MGMTRSWRCRALAAALPVLLLPWTAGCGFFRNSSVWTYRSLSSRSRPRPRKDATRGDGDDVTSGVARAILSGRLWRSVLVDGIEESLATFQSGLPVTTEIEGRRLEFIPLVSWETPPAGLEDGAPPCGEALESARETSRRLATIAAELSHSRHALGMAIRENGTLVVVEIYRDAGHFRRCVARRIESYLGMPPVPRALEVSKYVDPLDVVLLATRQLWSFEQHPPESGSGCDVSFEGNGFRGDVLFDASGRLRRYRWIFAGAGKPLSVPPVDH